jgi:uncharacterized protein YukE
VIVDAGHLRTLASRVHGAAEQVDDLGYALAKAADEVRWQSGAADGFRAAIDALRRALADRAGELDGAATALRRHAERVPG